MKQTETPTRALGAAFNGTTYHSHLSAQWALFFHLMGIEARYRPVSFDFGMLGNYTPDFFLPSLGLYAYVTVIPPSADWLALRFMLFYKQGNGVLLLDGPPDFRPYPLVSSAKDFQRFDGFRQYAFRYEFTPKYIEAVRRVGVEPFDREVSVDA